MLNQGVNNVVAVLNQGVNNVVGVFSQGVKAKRGRLQDLFTPELRLTTALLWLIWYVAACSGLSLQGTCFMIVTTGWRMRHVV